MFPIRSLHFELFVLLKAIHPVFLQLIFSPNSLYGCEGSLTIIGTESGIGEPGSNSNFICCIHFRTIGEGMNLSLTDLSYELNSEVDLFF